MSDKKELEVLEPQHNFYQVQIEILVEDSETGKVKKQKETHLIDAAGVTEVEQKVLQEMSGTMYDWKIIQVSQSKIQYVY